ncbi:pre-mRNA-splicing regulator WTAP-like [Babylonia areolata]|uniref:pre-mRNA-splicing regulator WTAP-like n=1 Tax=Babylonia areolata TaxID=304850 RepID=UPI003FD42D0E
MSEGPPSPKRLRLDIDDLGKLSKEDLVEKLRELDEYVSYLQAKQRGSVDKDDGDDKEGDDKSKHPSQDSSRRENTLVLRLTNKEQELQDCMNQIAEMKASQTQNSAQLRSLLLDPAVNLVFQRMAKEMDDCKEKLKQTQNERNAWKFTADSQMGMRLMAKCRMLLQENEELGKMISSGRTAKLEAEIAVQKTLVTEMKTNQDEMNEFVSELEEDVEGMQSMIYVLQRQLKETKENLAALEAENNRLRTLQPVLSVVKQEPAGSSDGGSNSVLGPDSSGGGGVVTCKDEGCAAAETTCRDDRTEESGGAGEGTKNVVANSNSSSEVSKARTADPLASQTAATKAETSPTPQQQASGPGLAKRTSGKAAADDVDSAQQQQTNGKAASDTEKSEHDCSLAAAESTDLRTDQACDKAQSVAATNVVPLDAAALVDTPVKVDRDSRPEGPEVKTVTPEAKPIRNGGLDGLTASVAGD